MSRIIRVLVQIEPCIPFESSFRIGGWVTVTILRLVGVPGGFLWGVPGSESVLSLWMEPVPDTAFHSLLRMNLPLL